MRGNILIIDDEKFTFLPFLENLEYEKISYDFCKNGSSGMKKLKENEYKAIILDMKVSLGDDLKNLKEEKVPGISIFKKIREINKKIPILCFSVIAEEEIKKEIESMGGKYYLKGQDNEKLRSKILSLIEI